MPPRLEKPEPRWEVAIALLAALGLYTALPESLSFGPRWLLAAVVVPLSVPTIIAHHRGRHSLNNLLGLVMNAVITLALIASLVLLVQALPAKKEAPVTLLISGFSLWCTNVLIFALWYWRLDGGGPHVRMQKGLYGSTAFLFPQLQIESTERELLGAKEWRAGFVDYLFLAFNTSTAFSPTDTLVLARWAKLLSMLQAFISITIVVILIARAINVL